MEEIEIIKTLREQGLTAKKIARQLGKRPNEIEPIIRHLAEEKENNREAFNDHLYDDRALPKLLKCCVFENNFFGRGLVNVTLLREDKNGFGILASYLVDTQCKGVKDAIEPRHVSESQYRKHISRALEAFALDSVQQCSLHYAQEIVFGGIEFAKKCGFTPHPDFKRAQYFLGKFDGASNYKFGGENGKPMYISGPNDNPDHDMRILRKNLGDGNFDFISHLGDPFAN